MAVLNFRARPMSSAILTATSTTAPAPTTRACQSEDPELFFPAAESRSALNPNSDEFAALAICARCPLAQRQVCLNEQLEAGSANQWGVSGGMTAAQRRYLLRSNRTAAKVTAQVARQLDTGVSPDTSSAAAAPVLPLAG